MESRPNRSGVPPRETFLIVTDYPYDNLVIKSLKAAGFNVMMYKDYSLMQENGKQVNPITKKMFLDPKADVFFMNTWSLSDDYKIDSEFLCKR